MSDLDLNSIAENSKEILGMSRAEMRRVLLFRHACKFPGASTELCASWADGILEEMDKATSQS